MKEGDVVFGPLPTREGDVLPHFGVVVEAKGEMLAVVYTTSIKTPEAVPGRRTFRQEELARAGFNRVCRYDPYTICLVAKADVVVKGAVSAQRRKQIRLDVQKARAGSGFAVCVAGKRHKEKA